MTDLKPRFFASPAAFGKWLAANHAKRKEILVGFHKVATGKPSLTWAQSVEQALAHGWIDGVRRSLGPEAYTIRFTPRKPGSHWSAVNVRTAQRLVAEGRMRPAGQAAFDARTPERTARASFEQGEVAFAAAQAKEFRAHKAAWAWFSKQAAPSYRKAATWWVVSAKRDATKARRLAQLIACSAEGKTVPQYTWRRKT
ncbi:MAG: hypothetical protein QOI63_157 [Thermoplasmata archaeon]|jgi:uncharacterized protein YdeI (YjbR/CyaY-like superfamily)|nr:hypothetical protein [Thermoplasmata archaeon]